MEPTGVLAHFRLRSSLSPQSDALLSPRLLSELLSIAGVRLAVLSDINTALNVPAFAFFCKEKGIAVLYGMEALLKDCSVLVIFNSLRLAIDFSTEWHRHLSPLPREQHQYFTDEHGAIIASVPKNLLQTVDIALTSFCQTVHSLGGIVLKADHFVPCTAPSRFSEGIVSLPLTEDFFASSPLHLKAVCTGFEKLGDGQILL